MSNTVYIKDAGLYSSVQDAGRSGFLAQGIPASGCMDMSACHDANVLVNNALGDAVLEMMFRGGDFIFGCDTYVALTGADMNAYLNNTPVFPRRAFRVKSGDELKMGCASSGRYAYLAVAGGFCVKPFMNSRSVCEKCGMGRRLAAGDILHIQRTPWLANGYKKSADTITYETDVRLRVVMGPQDDRFSENGIRTFLSERYEVSDESDRMGFRLLGKSVEFLNGTDILSDGIAPGSVQITAGGQPIILLAERQTVGGYAKIATVITPDIPKLVQCMPRASVCFSAVSVQQARKIYLQHMKEQARFRKMTGWCMTYQNNWRKKHVED